MTELAQTYSTPPLINLTIDGHAIAVPKGTSIHTATKILGIDIPVFCYHDRMPAFGACRVCLVEVEKMPKLQTSCTLEATEGMVVKTQSSQALEARKSILEFLLINHPLDCPICDKAGECPLQNQTLNHGPGESRFFELKRKFKKALPLGPVLMLDRERCISCARCTRFADLVSGDHALEFVKRGHLTEVGTPDSQPVQSKFIGNTIMICPVGALTSQAYRFKARPWDNQRINSTCTLCPVGCSMAFDTRDGEIMRTQSCENREINDIWLCDKGWFGYEFAAHPDRLKTPLIRKNGHLEAASWDEALSLVADKMLAAKEEGLIGALGGSVLTTEEGFLFQQLMRKGLNSSNLDYRVGQALPTLEEEGFAPGMNMVIGDCEKLSSALLLGTDLSEEFPLIWLRLKHAINYGAQVTFAGHYNPEIAQHLSTCLIHRPGDEIVTLKKLLPEWTSQLKQGKKAAVFVGRQYLNTPNRLAICQELEILQSAGVSINILEGSGNSSGARFAGLHPELGPWGERLANPGLNAQQMLTQMSKKAWDVLYVVGSNVAGNIAPSMWQQIRTQLKFLVVQDLFLSKTAQDADVVLPALCFVEKEGTFINIEGRKQKLQIARQGPENVLSDADIFKCLGEKFAVASQDPIVIPEKIKQPATTLSAKSVHSSLNHQVLHTQNNTSLKVTLAPTLFDGGERMIHNEHAALLIKAPKIRLHPSEALKRGLSDNSLVKVQRDDRFVNATLAFDTNIAVGSIVLPLGFSEFCVGELESFCMNGFDVDIHPLYEG